MSTEATDFLFGGGGAAAKFEQIGDKVEGTITEVRLAQQTGMEDGAPLTWPDGSPRMQLIIGLQTTLNDGENDDGVRKVYAKGGRYEAATGTGKSMKDAIADAVKAAKATSIEEGGTLVVAYTGEGKRTTRGYNPPKLYRASYKPPTQSVDADDLFA